MEYFALFNLLILALFLLSRQLTSEIYLFFLSISKRESFATGGLALVFFPGVVIHEIAHYMAAKFLFVHTGRISFMPKREGNYVKLGSVSVAESNFFKEFIIGVAPLFVGVIFILSIVFFMLQDFSSFNIIKIILSVIAIFVISNTMYASRKDLQAALPFLVFIIVVGIVLFVVDVRVPNIPIEWLPEIDINRIFYMGSLFLIIPILIDLGIILVLRIFNRMW